MTPAIEREKMRLLPCQPGCHVDFIRIGGEMHQGAFLELE